MTVRLLLLGSKGVLLHAKIYMHLKTVVHIQYTKMFVKMVSQ